MKKIQITMPSYDGVFFLKMILKWRSKMIKPIFRRIIIAAALVSVCSIVWAAERTQNKDPLLFPKDNFTVETKTVKTSAGEKKVTYRSYMHIPYVAKPVDKDYQSLNVSVPIKIDGVDVDATSAPILFVIDVGGYSSSNNATGGGMGGVGGGAPGGAPGGAQGGPGAQGAPSGAQQGAPAGDQGGRQGEVPQMAGGPGGPGGQQGGPPGGSNEVSKTDLALAAGYVVVEPGCRGRDNQAEDGAYYGKAPAGIVDLKAAVRYICHNKGILPGNVDWIVSTGCSAGGGMSSLLGASGNSSIYDAYLKEIGAADADDSIFGCGCYSPVTDLEHADMAYEFQYGATPVTSTGELVDQVLSTQVQALFAEYQASLNLKGKNGFGTLAADNYDKYLTQYYLIPPATKYLRELTDEKRKEYLENHKWIKWSNNNAAFTLSDFVAEVGRNKGFPAFDDFELQAPETGLFGNKTTNSRHFTDFTLQQTTGNPKARIDEEMQTLVNMMNPMYFIGQNNPGIAKHWWLRKGTVENGSGHAVFVNLDTSLENLGKGVNAWMYWDAGHCQDDDPEGFIAWIGDITGFTKKADAGDAMTLARTEIARACNCDND